MSASITPNQITTLSLVIGLLAALFYARGGWAAHLGAAFFVLSFWLDHVDGELARSTGRTSAFGHYYDLAAGGCVLVAVFVGIGIGMGAGTLGAWSPRLGAAAGIATTAIFVLRLALERRGGHAPVRQPNLLCFSLSLFTSSPQPRASSRAVGASTPRASPPPGCILRASPISTPRIPRAHGR